MSSVGDVLTETITIVDPAGDGIVGATWTILAARDPNGLPFLPLGEVGPDVVTDLAGGLYQFSYATTPATPPGPYYLLVQPDSADYPPDVTPPEFEIEWQLDPLAYAGVASAPRRSTVRQRIAQELDDYRSLTATGGSETTFTDPLELLDFDDVYIGAQLLITSGDAANVNRVARVVASSLSAATITFSPALPKPIQPGDTADLYNLRGRGVRLTDYNLAISGAVHDARRAICLEVQATPAPFAYDTPTVPVPDGWIAVCAAHTSVDEGSGDFAFAIPAARYEGQAGWYLRPQDRTVLVGGWYQELLDGRQITLTGYVPHPDVTSDESPIFTDQEWLRNTVKAALMARRRDRDSQQWAIEWAKRADNRKPLLITPFHSNTRFVDHF